MWVAATRATDDDVVLGEGRQIVFVAPDEVAPLDRTQSCAHFLDAFVGSAEHTALAAPLNG